MFERFVLFQKKQGSRETSINDTSANLVKRGRGVVKIIYFQIIKCEAEELA